MKSFQSFLLGALLLILLPILAQAQSLLWECDFTAPIDSSQFYLEFYSTQGSIANDVCLVGGTGRIATQQQFRVDTFEVSFDFRITAHSGCYGDGMVFFWHPNLTFPYAIDGSGGYQLGWASYDPNGFGVKFHDIQNPDRLSIVSHGVASEITSTSLPEMSDGNWHHAHIVNVDGNVIVFIDGSPRLSASLPVEFSVGHFVWSAGVGGCYSDHWIDNVAIFGSNNGYITLASPGPPDWHYNLNWFNGAVSKIVFSDFCTGTIGSVSGDAAVAGWTATNYTDSIVFNSFTPLTIGSIGTFTLSHPSCNDLITWQVGDSTGNVDGPLPVELLSFDATPLDGAIRISFSTASETDNDHFEILRGESPDEPFNIIATLPSQGNSAAGNNYVYVDEDVVSGHTYWYYLVDVNLSGSRTEHSEQTVSASIHSGAIPTGYSLSAYPNPFNPSTTIQFTLPVAERVRLVIYDLNGRQVNVLSDGYLQAGEHSMLFEAGNLPSGIYTARLSSTEINMSQKLLLVK